ncbi:site-specific integrase [Streptomyces anulatus]|uniref:site-specific integrase n=1 Tax=Streptomyces anulatus TaxID=1892 RepID=UPI0033D409AB
MAGGWEGGADDASRGGAAGCLCHRLDGCAWLTRGPSSRCPESSETYDLPHRVARSGRRTAEVTAHDFRRMFATEAVTGGLPVRIVARLLGHEDLATRQPYLAVFHDDRTTSSVPTGPSSRSDAVFDANAAILALAVGFRVFWRLPRTWRCRGRRCRSVQGRGARSAPG